MRALLDDGVTAGTLGDGAGKGEGWHAVELFWQQFRVGEDVVLEDTCGGLHVGRLERPRDDAGVRIRVGRDAETFDWAEIVFVAHAGFPVQAIRRMTPDQADRLAQRFDTARARNEILRLLREEPDEPTVTFGGGCPFVFEGVTVLALHNPGQNGPRWWGSGAEEELVLAAPDGARCLSYDLSHLFFLETAAGAQGFAP